MMIQRYLLKPQKKYGAGWKKLQFSDIAESGMPEMGLASVGVPE